MLDDSENLRNPDRVRPDLCTAATMKPMASPVFTVTTMTTTAKCTGDRAGQRVEKRQRRDNATAVDRVTDVSIRIDRNRTLMNCTHPHNGTNIVAVNRGGIYWQRRLIIATTTLTIMVVLGRLENAIAKEEVDNVATAHDPGTPRSLLLMMKTMTMWNIIQQNRNWPSRTSSRGC
jgi:hypothetical protein